MGITIDWLKGVRVILNAHYLPGPMTAYLLKNLGAEVIKVEPPFGDLMRNMPPFIRGKKNKKISAYFRTLNAGFKSIALDFKQQQDVAIFERLIQQADVLIDGNRAHYLERTVLGKSIATINPKLIYIPITAYGLQGPMRDRAGHDNNVLSLAGNLSYTSTSHEGLPSVFGAQLADITTGYIAALMAVSALFSKKNKKSMARTRTIDVSMLHSAFFLNQLYFAAMNIVPASPQPEKELLNGGLGNYRMYKTKDKKAIFFGPIEKKLFEKFCKAIHRDDLMDLLFKNNAQLMLELKKLFKSKTKAKWQSLLKTVDCCFSAVNSLKAAMYEPQIRALGLVSHVADKRYGRLRLANFPAGFGNRSMPSDACAGQAPELDEHRADILHHYKCAKLVK